MTRGRGRVVRAGLVGLVALTATAACGDQTGSVSAVPAERGDAAGTRTAPASRTPTFTPPEPMTSPSGLTLEVGPVEAGLGHRAAVVTLTNDGDTAVTIEGYPDLDVLDAGGTSLEVTVEHDSSYMAIDPGAAPVRLVPGDEVLSVVSWSATVTDADPNAVENGSYIVVTAAPGEPAQTFPLDTDLGTTGRISITAWAADLVH